MQQHNSGTLHSFGFSASTVKASPGNRVVSISFGAVGVVMEEGPFVLVKVQGTNADGLFCVKSKLAEPPVTVHDAVEDDTEVVRVVVDTDYVNESCEEIVHMVLPVSFNTVKPFVLSGEQTQPDQSFCKEFLGRHGSASISLVNLGQRQARLQDAFAVRHSAQLQGWRAVTVSVSVTHPQARP